MGRYREAMKGRHIMIDGETFSLGASCVFVQLAALEFFPADPGRECRMWSTYIDINDSIRVGRQLDGDTILWWMDDSGAGPEARQALVNGLKDHKGDGKPLGWREALEQLDAFVTGPVGRGMGAKPEPIAGIWSHGAAFDISRLETAYKDLRMEVPWSHREVLDTRTIFRLCGRRMEDLFNHEENGMVLHDAVADVHAQAIAILSAIELMDGEV